MSNTEADYVGGVFNLVGVRPGGAFAFDDPIMPRMVWYTINFTSTYEAIETYILPPPLKADRSVPPSVSVSFFINNENKAYDGGSHPYRGLIFQCAAEHEGLKGTGGFEYVDGVNGDKTYMDALGSWGMYFGMLKKYGNMHFTPVGVNEFEITVERRGVRIIKMRIRTGEESPEGAAAANVAMNATQQIMVREYPNDDFSDNIDRVVLVAPVKGGNLHVERLFAAEPVALEFGHLDLDPLSEIPIHSLDSAVGLEVVVSKEIYKGVRTAVDLRSASSAL